MIGEGEGAPRFELPAVVDGDIAAVTLEEYLGDTVVVLAFYPADFNPACDEDSTGLDELDLFTMQKDVAILGVSADSVYSHRAFADRYDLSVPLLADTRAAVAADYGVAGDGEGYLTERAVFVIDPEGTIQYAWSTPDLETLPDVDAVREAVEGIGGGKTAAARYRVGHAHYVEGRRAFTSGMHAFEDREWMMARNDFAQARTEFAEAVDQFDTAGRFAEDDQIRTYYERAEAKAEELDRASEWLAQAGNAFASGEGTEGQTLRQDAEAPLETARDIHEPVPPENFPPDEDPAEADEKVSVLPEREGQGDVSLDESFDADDASDSLAEASGTGDGDPSATDNDGASGDDEIDEAELEEIAAEIEEQTEAVQETEAADDDAGDDGTGDAEEGGFVFDEKPDSGGDSSAADADADSETKTETGDTPEAETDTAGGVEADLDEDDIELDLTDPTEGKDVDADSAGERADSESEDAAGDDEDDEDDDEDEDEEPDELTGGSDHGVPDSL